MRGPVPSWRGRKPIARTQSAYTHCTSRPCCLHGFLVVCTHTYIRSVLVLTQERQVQQDCQRRRVGGEDDDLGDTSVESLGRLVGALLQLTVVRGLLHEVEDLLREGLVGDRPGSGFGCHFVDEEID